MRGMAEWVFPKILEEKAQTDGDRPFLQYEDESPVEYAEVNRKANRVANGLAYLGLSKGDKIIIMMNNSLEFIYTCFGAMKLGAIQVTATTYKPDYLQYLITQVKPKVLVLSDGVLTSLLPIKEALYPVDKVVIWSERKGKFSTLGLRGKDIFDFDRLYDFPETPPRGEVRHSDSERINYVFKASGQWMGVPKTYAQNYMSVMNYIEKVNLTSGDVCLICSSLAQSYTQVFGVYPALLANAKVVILKGFNRRLFWHQVRRVGATVLNCLGAMLYFLWLQPWRSNDADNPLRVIVTNIWSTREYFLSWGTVTMDGQVLVPEGWKGFQCEFEDRFNVKLLDGSDIEGFGPTEEQMPTSMFFWPM